MLNIALTFDYELFFGENYGSDDEILFAPTQRLLDVMDARGIKGTFFVDVLSVYMHEQYGLTDYCKKFIAQIQQMIRAGHDVQLHIHSNWLCSEWRDGQWVFDTESYRLHTFGFDTNKAWSVSSIVAWGKTFLETHLKAVNPQYACVAYRAGGYCIQPHTDLFEALNQNGIWIDSSVAVQQKGHGINVYDYTAIPVDRTGWWVNNKEALEKMVPAEQGQTFELPIGCVANSLVRRILSPETERNLKLGKLRGTYIGKTVASTPKKRTNRLKLLLTYINGKRMLSCDYLHYCAIKRALLKLEKSGKKTGYVAVIGHPKLINDVWLQNMNALLQACAGDKHIRFTTVADIGRELRSSATDSV
ncbi:MAG: hypothetical protein IJO75_02905 [Clostridia bacterium]|nr:hypothetical protein [Clostridia bacterium]